MSSRFAVATQILTVVASEPDRVHRSEDLAAWAGTNPAVIRRILQMLGRAGLTRSQLGKGGGTRLAKDAHEVTLADIYAAVEDGPVLAMPRCGPDESCRFGAHIGEMVRAAARGAEEAMVAELARTSLGDLIAALTAAKTS